MTEEGPRLRDRRGGSWYYNENALIDEYAAKIGVTGIAVYNVLTRHANTDDVAFPKIGYMGKLLGISESTVRRALRTLLDEGMVEKVSRFNAAGGQIANDYQLSSLKGGRVSPVTGGGCHPRHPSQEDLGKNSSLKRADELPPSKNAKQKESPAPSTFSYMNQYADQLDEALALSSRERVKTAGQIQAALDRGVPDTLIGRALSRLVARRDEGMKLEFTDTLTDIQAGVRKPKNDEVLVERRQKRMY